MNPEKDPRPLLRRLANLLQETSDCLNQLIDSYGDEAESKAPRDVPAAPHRHSSWESVVEVSLAILRETPQHTWRWDEFCGLLRARGVTLETWRGVNGRLLLELKKRGVVEVEGRGKSFRGLDIAAAPAAANEPRPSTKTTRETRPRRRRASEQPAADSGTGMPWDELVRLSKQLLEDQVGQRWTASQLCQALRDRGVALQSWKSVPFGLAWKLHARRVVECSRDGSFVVLERPQEELLSARSGLRDSASEEPRPVNSRSSSTKRKRGATVADVGAKSHAGTPIQWDELVRFGKLVLADHAGERWTGAQLCQALRDRGVVLTSWKGVPFGLAGRLHTQRVIERAKDGSFLVLEQRAEATASVPTPASDDTSPSRPPIAEPEDGDDVHGLVEEIDAVAAYLFELPHRQVTSQICLWAGRARRIAETLGNRPPEISIALKRALNVITSRLLEVKRRHNSGWVDALSSAWSTDWDIYIAYHQAIVGGYEPELTREQEQTYHRDILRGLFIGPRKVGRVHAHRAMHEALPLLGEGDVVASKAIQMFGRPPERRVEEKGPPPHQRRADRAPVPSEPEPEVRRDLPEELLALTRGKRMLIAGGQGARDAHRAAIQDSLGLADVEWVTTERGKGSPFNRLEERMRPGRYDLVLFLASHSSHQAGGFVKACKSAEIPLVFLPRGYSVTSVAQAISQQLLSKRVPEWMADRAGVSAARS